MTYRKMIRKILRSEVIWAYAQYFSKVSTSDIFKVVLSQYMYMFVKFKLTLYKKFLTAVNCMHHLIFVISYKNLQINKICFNINATVDVIQTCVNLFYLREITGVMFFS